VEKLLRLELDLADALARHAPALADLLERAWVILLEPVVDDVPGQLADPLPDLAERVADLTVPLGEEVRVLRAGPSSSIRSRWVASPSSSIGLSSDRSGCATVPLLGRTVDRAAFRYFPMYARIHQTAYVEKRVPACGSNFSTARMRPTLPSWMTSSRRTVPRRCLRAMATTNARLCRTSFCFALSSPFRARMASACSPRTKAKRAAR